MAKDYCAHCGRELNGHGLVLDDIDIFCDRTCAFRFFGYDIVFINKLINEGRLVVEK